VERGGLSERTGYGEGFRLAAERAAVLQAMGAGRILITPMPDSQRMGHFVVAGVREYKQANLAALAATLHAEWAAFEERQAAAAHGRSRKRRWFFARRPLNGGARWPRRQASVHPGFPLRDRGTRNA
jgi:hypothetical protein